MRARYILAFSFSSEFEYLPEPDLIASQYIKSVNARSGEVVVAIDNDPDTLQSAIDSMLDGMGEGEIIVSDDNGYNIETYQIAGVGDEGCVFNVLARFWR